MVICNAWYLGHWLSFISWYYGYKIEIQIVCELEDLFSESLNGSYILIMNHTIY
jgi:hypothetical protein